MKLVGMLIALLIVAGLVIVQMKQLGGSDSRPTKPISDKFRKRCIEVSATVDKPQPYCACLWRSGVTNLGRLVSDPEAQAIAARCKSKSR